MNILFYVEPLVERDNPLWKKGWLLDFMHRMVSSLSTADTQAHEFACITGSALGATARQVLGQSRVATIGQTELIPAFGANALDAASRWYLGQNDAATTDAMAALIKRKLGGYVPDVCITFSPAPFLQTAFPQSQTFHFELGMISRPPFPETIYLDPCGMFSAGMLGKFAEQIRAHTASAEAEQIVRLIRERYCTARADQSNPVYPYVADIIARFQSAILLPLQFSSFYAYDANATYKDQYDLLINVLEATPRDVAVVVCEHPEYEILRADLIEHLTVRYPNFVWHPMFRVVYGTSHYLMPFVQGVVSVSSSVGLQAMLWQKPLAVLGHSHLDVAADGHDIPALLHAMVAPWPQRKENVLAWILSRFHLPSALLLQPRILEAWLAQVRASTFEQFNATELSAGLRDDTVLAWYQEASNSGWLSPKSSTNKLPRGYFFAALYFATTEESFNELNCVRSFGQWGAEPSVIEFQLPAVPFTALRLDPVAQPDMLMLSELQLSDATGQPVWQWDRTENGLGALVNIVSVPVLEQRGLLLQCDNDDPQIFPAIDAATLAAAAMPLKLRAVYAKAGIGVLRYNSRAMMTAIAEANLRCQQLEADREKLVLANKIQLKKIAENEGLLARFKKEKEVMSQRLGEQNKLLGQREASTSDLATEINTLKHEIAALRGSTSWRVAAPVRWVGAAFGGSSPLRKGRVALYVGAARRGARAMPRMIKRQGGAAAAVRRVLSVLRHEGLHGLKLRLYRRLPADLAHVMAPPVQKGELPTAWHYRDPVLTADIAAAIANMPNPPRFSVVTPTYNTDLRQLQAMIESVQAQWYPHWELCIADDCSSDEKTRRYLSAIDDPRVKVAFQPQNGGISAASNAAAALATGDYIALLDHDDLYTPDALYKMAVCIGATAAEYIYSDEDKIDEAGRYSEPFFKPAWSPDAFMSIMYTCHLSCFSRALFDRVGGFRIGYEGAQDYDLVLRMSEVWQGVAHIPEVLYHWRIHSGSIAASAEAKPYAIESLRKAKLDALARRGLQGELEAVPQMPGQYRVKYAISGNPKVSIIIPTRDKIDYLQRCIDSIISKTGYLNYEIIVVDNGSEEAASLACFAQLEREGMARVVNAAGPFNFSAINNKGVAAATGDYLLFLNNDTEIIEGDWLERMLGFAQLPHVGAVGARLLFEHGTLQHCGVVNLADGPGHAFYDRDPAHPYYFGRSLLDYNWLAVTAACLLVSREKFEQVGGFNEALAVGYNDVDLCFKLYAAGYFNVVAQAARLYHYESVSRGLDDIDPTKLKRLHGEKKILYRNHPHLFGRDPFYNPNLHPNSGEFLTNW